MTTKADFNAEEWTTIVEAPVLAGLGVATAERGGTLRESVAIGKTYAAARQAHGASPLLDEIVASPPVVDPSRLREGGGDIQALAATRLRDAVALVDAKASAEEAQAYKEFVVTVAEGVAAAHREGGFAGIGGKPVSESEQAALDKVRATLGLTS
jgi:hypothetical protein